MRQRAGLLVVCVLAGIGIAPTPARAVTTISLDVPVNGTVVPVGLVAGVWTVVASGIANYDPGGQSLFDAECTTPHDGELIDDIGRHEAVYPVAGWQAHRFAGLGAPDPLDLEVDGVEPEWVPTVPSIVGDNRNSNGPGLGVGCNERDHTYLYAI
ncbi:MAG TPA: hypothetical protein VGQ20_03505, partial [Acidimicrobiales bacterium]|nr:hypothetical protein [Acidimicrobiales bacterium]